MSGTSAVSPSRPTSPQPLAMTLLLATIAGVFIGIAIALCWEWLDQRVRGLLDLEQGLGLTVLAYIPAEPSVTKRKYTKEAIA